MTAFIGDLYAEFTENEFAEIFKNNRIQSGVFSDEVLEIGIKFGFMRWVEYGEKPYIGIDFYKWSQVTANLRTNITDGCFL